MNCLNKSKRCAFAFVSFDIKQGLPSFAYIDQRYFSAVNTRHTQGYLDSSTFLNFN